MPSTVDAMAEPAVRADSRYPVGRSQAVIAGTTTEVGHTEDLRIYFVGWSEGDLVYTVEATYTHSVPAVQSEALRILKGAAEEVAGLILGGAVTGPDL